MNRKIKTIRIVAFNIALSIFIAGCIIKAVRIIIQNEQTPCNPIRYPNSYDTNNPDCECNKE
jgi:hypothetical protein